MKSNATKKSIELDLDNYNNPKLKKIEQEQLNLNNICKQAQRIYAETINKYKLVSKINKILYYYLEYNFLWFCNYLKREIVSK